MISGLLLAKQNGAFAAAGIDVDVADGKGSLLHLRIRLGNVPDLLQSVGTGKLRVSLAVQHAKDAPFVHHDEKPLEGSGPGRIYVYEAPLAGEHTDALTVYVRDHIAAEIQKWAKVVHAANMKPE